MQALKDVTRQWRSLPHDTDRVKRQKSLNDCVRIGNVITEDGDFGPAGDGRPVRQAERDILIVIEDRDFHVSIPFKKSLQLCPGVDHLPLLAGRRGFFQRFGQRLDVPRAAP